MHGLRFRLRLLVVLRLFQFGIDPGQQVIDTDPGTAKASGGRPPVARHRRPQQEPEPGLPEGLREAMEKSEMRARDAAAGGPVGVDGTPVSTAPPVKAAEPAVCVCPACGDRHQLKDAEAE